MIWMNAAPFGSTLQASKDTLSFVSIVQFEQNPGHTVETNDQVQEICELFFFERSVVTRSDRNFVIKILLF